MSDNAQDAARWDAVEDATELLRERDYEGAERELRAVLERDGGNPYAHFFLAAVHFERGEFAEAEQGYRRALGCAPGYLGAVVGLGHSLRLQDKLDEATRAGEQALTLGGTEGGDADAHFLLGLVHAARGDTRAAEKHLEAFLESNPELEARGEAEAVLETLRGKARPLEAVRDDN